MVGASLANPLGSDTVDFAVLTFLRSGAVNSRHIIEVQEEWVSRHPSTPPLSQGIGGGGGGGVGGGGGDATLDGQTARAHPMGQMTRQCDGGGAGGNAAGIAAGVRPGGAPSLSEASQRPSRLRKPGSFKSSLLDSYDGALGGCAPALLRRVTEPGEPHPSLVQPGLAAAARGAAAAADAAASAARAAASRSTSVSC